MINAVEDGLVRTHDEALSVLRRAVPGAHVETYPTREHLARSYVVTLERIGHARLSESDVYALPIEVDALTERARKLADAAVRAAER